MNIMRNFEMVKNIYLKLLFLRAKFHMIIVLDFNVNIGLQNFILESIYLNNIEMWCFMYLLIIFLKHET